MIRFVPLGGFLGAGKTTTMLAAARLLEAGGERVSLITNDQGADLVDTQLARAAGIGVGEVTGGCFCCRFEDLAAVVSRLADQVNPTVVIAEAVGSCTDLQSTVVRPLRRLYGDQLRTAPLTVALDPVRHSAMKALAALPGGESDLAYLYRHQLDEADIIAVNKTDLLAPAVLESLKADLAARFGHARVVTYSAATGAGLAELLDLWRDSEPSGHSAFAVDYDRYAAAEAGLAWTNQTFGLSGAGFAPSAWARAMLAHMSAGAAAAGATIGHVKVRVSVGGVGAGAGAGVGADPVAAKASVTAAGAEPSFDSHVHAEVTAAEVTLNARVELGVEDLEALIAEAVAAADEACSTVAGRRTGDIFQPSYPVPVHRM